jgi:hypothetical protein
MCILSTSMRSRAKYSLAETFFEPHKMVLPFNAFWHLHLDELISPKNVAEAIQTFIRRVTIPFSQAL